jgi:hypothetical protein
MSRPRFTIRGRLGFILFGCWAMLTGLRDLSVSSDAVGLILAVVLIASGVLLVTVR